MDVKWVGTEEKSGMGKTQKVLRSYLLPILALSAVSACGQSDLSDKCQRIAAPQGADIVVGDIRLPYRTSKSSLQASNDCGKSFQITFPHFDMNSDPRRKALILSGPDNSASVTISSASKFNAETASYSRLWRLVDGRRAKMTCGTIIGATSQRPIGSCAFSVEYTPSTTLISTQEFHSTDEKDWKQGIETITQAVDGIRLTRASSQSPKSR